MHSNGWISEDSHLHFSRGNFARIEQYVWNNSLWFGHTVRIKNMVRFSGRLTSL